MYESTRRWAEPRVLRWIYIDASLEECLPEQERLLIVTNMQRHYRSRRRADVKAHPAEAVKHLPAYCLEAMARAVAPVL